MNWQGSEANDGYLSKLLDRVLPDAPVLQRRQPSLFEPDQPPIESRTRVAGDVVDGAVRATSESSGAVAERPPAAQAPPVAMPQPHTRPGSNDASAPPPAAVPDPPVVRHEWRAGRETLRIDPALRIVHDPAAPPPVRARIESPGITAPAAGRAPDYAVRDLPAQRAAVQPVPRPAKPASRTAPRPTAQAPTVSSSPKHAPRAEAAAAPVGAKPPHPLPPVSTQAARRAAATKAILSKTPVTPPPDLPPVQVTIGRVEVRAVVAPPAAKPSRRSEPRLSLEQYLRERSEGAR